jgi:hypothetical protein
MDEPNNENEKQPNRYLKSIFLLFTFVIGVLLGYQLEVDIDFLKSEPTEVYLDQEYNP